MGARALIRHAHEVVIGGVYAAKVGNRVTAIRIDRQVIVEHPTRCDTQWIATALDTGRRCKIKRAWRLRRRLDV